MKNKILILLLAFIFTSGQCLAVQEGNVVSDGDTQKKLMEAFDEVNKYSNSFFTPSAAKIQAKKDKVKSQKKDGYRDVNTRRGSMLPVPRLKMKIQSFGKPKTPQTQVEEDLTPQNQAILDCDNMEYFADKTELQADGNVVMFFPKNNSTLKADRMIYNQSSNLIKAFGNVVLISDGKELLGDYMQVDLNEENALVNNPISDLYSINIKAKKGYMYGDKLIEEQGRMLVTKRKMIDFKADMFGPDLDRMFVSEQDKGYLMKEAHGSKFKIKTNDLIINSKKEHDTVTLKHAEIYMNGKKIGTIPKITVHTNKAQDYIEADYPEIGTVSNLGMYAGPGFVFDTPGGTTLKVLPILNYQSNGDNTEDNKIGWGGIAKFKSSSNKTDFAYGTANEMFIVRGLQLLDDNLYFQYASNAYQDDWFMGFRMPKLGGELVYQDSFVNEDFIGENQNMIYTHRLAAGYIQDGIIGNKGAKLGEDGVGTLRFKYMGEVAQTLYSLGDETKNAINARLELVGQAATTVYGTGDTQMIGRVGPRLHSQYKYWMQDVGYFLSAYDDKTPLVNYDRYMYGRSNAYLRESFRICKYLTISWLGSLNLSGDSWNGNLLQENSFFFGIGPDDIRLNIGYDTVRQQSFVTLGMHLDAKGSSIEYKKMVVKNPDTLGKSKQPKASQAFESNSDKKQGGTIDLGLPAVDDDGNIIPIKAEVINISQDIPGEI